MAKIKENKKGFKIIEISRAELVGKLAEYGCIGICDNCNSTSITGYYIAVLNQWFCQKCFDECYTINGRMREFCKMYGANVVFKFKSKEQ